MMPIHSIVINTEPPDNITENRKMRTIVWDRSSKEWRVFIASKDGSEGTQVGLFSSEIDFINQFNQLKGRTTI